MNDHPCVEEELTVWFKQRLVRGEVQFGDEPMSYEANTQYDVQFYRLQKEAAAHWQSRYGFVPTPGQLMQGFFGAEYERLRQAKLDRQPWTDKLRRGLANALREVSLWIKRGFPA